MLTIREADFYARQQGYWERANDNLAAWLHVQHLTPLDVVIVAPLFPLILFPFILWLPRDRPLWDFLPKALTGPYLLYCAFALWHIHRSGWASILAAIGAALCIIAIKDAYILRKSGDETAS
jgi:hypothetical protein